MESFTFLRKHLAMSGIRLKQSSQNRSFNIKNSSVLILFSFGIILYPKQFSKINTFEDRVDIIFNMVTLCWCTAIYLSIVYKTPDLFRLIDDLDEIVNKSKWALNMLHFSTRLQYISISFNSSSTEYLNRGHKSRITYKIRRNQSTNYKLDKICTCHHYIDNSNIFCFTTSHN